MVNSCSHRFLVSFSSCCTWYNERITTASPRWVPDGPVVFYVMVIFYDLLATVLTFLLVSPLHNIYFVLHKRFLRHSVSISRMKPMPGDDSLTGPWSLDFKKKQKSSKIRVHCWIKVVSSRALLLRKSLHYWIVKELSSVYFHLHLSSFQHIQFIPSGHWWSFIKGLCFFITYVSREFHCW